MTAVKMIECDECGKAFIRLRRFLKLYQHYFCSQECYHQFTQKNKIFKGRNNPNYHGGKIILCKNCGKKIWRTPTRLHKTKHYACSQRCWNIIRKKLKLHVGNRNHNWRGGLPRCLDCGRPVGYQNTRCAGCNYKLLSGENSSAWRGGKIQKTCKICKKVFDVDRNQSKTAKFCSIKCRSKWQSISLAGQNAPFFGRHHSEKSKKKISGNHIYFKGAAHPNFGKHSSEETKRKIRENHADFKGAKHPNWRGGLSREPYSWDFNEALKELIRKRDRHKCRLCQVPQEECFQRLSIHHIDYDKKNSDPKNLISLCEKCHRKTNINREYWTIFWGSKNSKEVYAHTKK